MNSVRITQTAATIAALMGLAMPRGTDLPCDVVMETARRYFGGQAVERVLLYNPDAIALWLYQKYTALMTPVVASSQMTLPVLSVMPSVTPVCFASMYTGLAPKEHGIMSYRKPVLRVPTLFDVLIEAGKRPIIISTVGDSISEIFKERDMDYIFCETAEECNKRAAEVLAHDSHDLLVVYNGNYDSTMHKNGPEAEASLAALRHNAESYASLAAAASAAWQGKRTVTAFLPDHGCHEIDGGCGSHGLDMPEDMDIVHFYAFSNVEDHTTKDFGADGEQHVRCCNI